MDQKYRAGQHKVKPNLFSFNSVLNVLATSHTETAALKADQLLLRMKNLSRETGSPYSDVKPDIVSYTSVIGTWAGIKTTDAAERAEALLRMIEKESQSDSAIHLDVVIYNKVILAWTRNSNPIRAERILREMESSNEIKPDGFSYKTFFLAWSKHDGGAKRAETILDLMERRFQSGHGGFKPDELCYKAVGAAWKSKACQLRN
jgi:pentatricopeptide repeat protein